MPIGLGEAENKWNWVYTEKNQQVVRGCKMNVLILYGSMEGQTKKIAKRLAENIRNKGYQDTTQSGE